MISLLAMGSQLLAAAETEAADQAFADPDLALWTLFIFLILMALLYAFAWGPICEALDKREQSIREDIEKARVGAEDAERVLAEYNAKLAAAGEEASSIVAGAREEADKARERIVNEGKDEAERIRQRGYADVESAKKAAVNALAQSSVDNAVGLAGRMIGKDVDKDAHAELIRESLEKFSTN